MPINLNNGSWRTARIVYVKDGGVWRPMRRVWTKTQGIWRLVYGTNDTQVDFVIPRTTLWTVPEGVFSITLTGCGGGGQGGRGDFLSRNDGPGWGGGGSNLITQGPFDVTPGQVLTITVGAGGSSSPNDGNPGGNTTVVSTGISFSAAGGGGGAQNDGIFRVGPVSAWNSFMNNYAVYGTEKDYTTIINFPTSGTYTFNFSVYNYGSISLDGTPVISLSGSSTSHFTTTTTQTVSVSSGNHTIRVQVVNTGGPAGVAAQILNPNSTELWNTRNLIGESFGGGGVGANGANNGVLGVGGTSTNGGANGGSGGNWNRRQPIPGFPGQNGKLTISW